jgi:CheY-like chemotaxis protein
MPRILLVEDDPDVRVLMQHVLIAERYQVDAVATAASGCMLLARGPYDLVLTDGRLPDGSGIAVAEDATRRGTQAIVVTAYAFQIPQHDLARYELLLKPVRPAELLEAVRRAVGQPSASTPITRV